MREPMPRSSRANAIVDPSGDQAAWRSAAGPRVRTRSSPPAASIATRWTPPAGSFLEKTSLLPSGENAGWSSYSVPGVRSVTLPPPMPTTAMRHLPTAGQRWNATRLPSGETAGSSSQDDAPVVTGCSAPDAGSIVQMWLTVQPAPPSSHFDMTIVPFDPGATAATGPASRPTAPPAITAAAARRLVNAVLLERVPHAAQSSQLACAL